MRWGRGSRGRYGVDAVREAGPDVRHQIRRVVHRLRCPQVGGVGLIPGRIDATTCAPRAPASWIANVPTPPVAPTTRTVAPSVGSIASMALIAVVPATPRVAAVGSSRPSGEQRSTAPGGWRARRRSHRGPRLCRRASRDRGSTDLEAPVAITEALDHPGDVHADHRREPVLHVLLHRSHGHEGVVGVHRGRADPDEHLARPGCRHGDVEHRRRSVEGAESECLHRGRFGHGYPSPVAGSVVVVPTLGGGEIFLLGRAAAAAPIAGPGGRLNPAG